MKKLFLILLVSAFVFSACNKTEDPDSFNFKTESKFQHGIMNQSSDSSLRFSITEINDSRCPSDVVCVWEGKADVKIVVESPTTGSIVLSTFNNRIDTVGNYSFELIDVSPHPVSTKTLTLDDYIVTLAINDITQNN